MMAKFSGDTRYCILTENSPSAAANELNSLLFSAGIEEKFITLSLSVLDIPKRTLTLTSAGHLPVMIRRANGTIDEIGEEIAGFPLGIIPEADYKQTEVKLYPGDVVAVFSDGVTDRPQPPRGAVRVARESPAAPQGRRDLRGPGGGGPRDPPGHPRVLRRTRPGRRHHPDLLRPPGALSRQSNELGSCDARDGRGPNTRNDLVSLATHVDPSRQYPPGAG